MSVYSKPVTGFYLHFTEVLAASVSLGCHFKLDAYSWSQSCHCAAHCVYTATSRTDSDFFSHLANLASGSNLSDFPGSHFRTASKCRRTSHMKHEPFKRVRLSGCSEMVADVVPYKSPTDDITSIPVPRWHGRTPPSRPLPLLLSPDSWLWLYRWKPFLNDSFQGRNGEGLVVPVIYVRPTIIDENDGSTLQVHCNCFGEIILLMSVFLYVCPYSNHLNVRHFFQVCALTA